MSTTRNTNGNARSDERLDTSAPIPATMTAVVARRYGTPDVMAIDEVPTPSAGACELLIHVEASSLNPLDWHFVTGTPYFIRTMYGLRRPKHPIRGADVAGTVVRVGPDVEGFEPGDAVFGEGERGSFAPYVAVRADRVAHKPAAVSFEAAAAAPVAGLTALQGLRTHAQVQPGERVLVNGGAGGVGTFAVQIAVALGAEVTAVCSGRNVDLVRSLGAAEVIDYERDDFVTRGPVFDVMLDNVGNRTAKDCLTVLRADGRYVAISGPKDNRWFGPVPKMIRTGLAFKRAPQRFHQFTESPNRDDLTRLAELMAAGKVNPVIDRVVGLDGVAGGLALIGTGHARAKIVVKPR